MKQSHKSLEVKWHQNCMHTPEITYHILLGNQKSSLLLLPQVLSKKINVEESEFQK